MRPAARVPTAGLTRSIEVGPRSGRIEVPRSKSIAQRALVFGAAAPGPSTILGVPDSGDVLAARTALQALGIELEPTGANGVRVHGLSLTNWTGGRVAVGESATLARLLLGLLGTTESFRATLAPTGSLRSRKCPALRRALESIGARVTGSGYELDVQGGRRSPPWELREPDSSQDVSALLGALAARGGGQLHIHGELPSAPYVELTRSVLGAFGVEVARTSRGFRVVGSLQPLAVPLQVEIDASSAAVALCLAATSAGAIEVRGLPLATAQGDRRIVEHLRAFGVEAEHTHEHLVARGAPTRGAALDLRGEPDLAPPLAAVAARAARDLGVTSKLTGLQALRGKESDRVRVLGEGLELLGFRVEQTSDSLSIGRCEGRPAPQELDPRGDHRMAFAFALTGTFVPGVRVRNAECVDKSWPAFWDALAVR